MIGLLGTHYDVVQELFEVGFLIEHMPVIILNDLGGNCSKFSVTNIVSQAVAVCKSLKVRIGGPDWHRCRVVLGSGRIVVRFFPCVQHILLFYLFGVNFFQIKQIKWKGDF